MDDILVARVKPKCESKMSNDVCSFLYYEYCNKVSMMWYMQSRCVSIRGGGTGVC